MRLARVCKNNRSILAIQTQSGLFDLSEIRDTATHNLLDFLSNPRSKLASVKDDIDRAHADGCVTALDCSTIEFHCPIERPGKIICLGLNYVAHAQEGGFITPDYPTIFMRGSTSLTSHNGTIKLPLCSDKLDFEGEMAVIIGRKAYNVSEENALNYVAGYSVFNDGTIRDYQKRTSQWDIGKNFDSTGGFGPYLVTPDELPEGARGLSISTRLNGKIMQNASTSDMIFPVAKIIELLSECMTLEPGDILVSGTPEGVGYVRKPPVYMKKGDECIVEIEGIGRLVNTVG